MTEAELVKALRRGSPDALAELIDCYTPYIPSVIARILRGRQADVEELTADVFLAAWNNRDKLRPGQVKGYLGTIARNRAFNRLRSECESLPLEDDIRPAFGDGRPRQGAGQKGDRPRGQRGAGPAGQAPAGAVRAALLLWPDCSGGGAGPWG